jgi:cell division protein FtsX
VSRHGWREVRRQLRESGAAGIVAVVLVAVTSAWGGMLWNVHRWVEMRLLDRSLATSVIVVARGGREAAALQTEVRTAYPALTPALLAPREVQEQLARWFPDLGQALLTLTPESFPYVLHIAVEPAQEPALSAWFAARPEVTLVESSRAWQRKLADTVARLTAAGTLLAGTLLAGCTLVVLLVIRLLVLAHADEIAIMRLIGAHEGEIRRPYLICGTILGFVGGAAGGGVLLAFGGLLRVAVSGFEPVAWVAAALPFVGAVATLVGAALGLAALPAEP